MRTRDIKSANRDAYLRDSAGRLGKCYYCGQTVYFLHKGNNKWEVYESWRAGNCDEDEWIPHFCSSYTANRRASSSNDSYADSTIAKDEVVCNNCYLLMPRTLAKCDNCGAKLP